ncbi:MAG TPA: hypothetical protein VFP06_10890 [Acidimicrobiales bacterium]|nr:hypothetical protein [Acidimicrobiales bacterium]
MSDTDQPGEDLDDAKLSGEYPPDRPLAVDDQGVTGVEQLGGESFADRDGRTEPEVWERPAGAAGDQGGVELVGEHDVGEPDDEKDLVGELADPADRALGPLAEDDEVSGDETTRDVATERVTPPAEDEAVHIDEPPA